LLDGKAIRSCIVYAIEVDGHDVITVEGLQANGLTDLQKSFLAHNSFQCGFCAPGMIIQATELLNENPHPDEEEIREYIAGNLCRCTGYNPIVEAIMDVAKKK
jgi:carbon-monoxide dehydrogenase small subunit